MAAVIRKLRYERPADKHRHLLHVSSLRVAYQSLDGATVGEISLEAPAAEAR